MDAARRIPERLALGLATIREQAGRAAVLADFDGTLSPIVEDPAAARPLPGVSDALVALARSYGRVGVVSGRPASFLLAHIGTTAVDAGVVLAGLYGLERATKAGVEVHPDAARWREAVEAVASEAEAAAPRGAVVERKGLSVTLHWRSAPGAEGWARDLARTWGRRTGLAVHPGKRSLELRPSVGTDKGTVVAELAAGLRAACFMGDDVGDLPAFDALRRLAGREGMLTLAVAVGGPEAPPELLAAADGVVSGPEGALAVLRGLAPA